MGEVGRHWLRGVGVTGFVFYFFPFEGMPASEVLCALLSVREYTHHMPSSPPPFHMTYCGCLMCTQVLRGPH